VAKSGASYIARIANYAANINPATGAINYNTSYFPVTNGFVVPFNSPVVGSATPPAVPVNTADFWQALSGNLILPTDTRYAWVPFYSRGLVPGRQPGRLPLMRR